MRYGRAQWLLMFLLFWPLTLWAASEFSISNGPTEIIYTTDQLLKRPDKIDLTIPLLNYPGESFTVSAVPLRNLLREAKITDEHFVIFKCFDGFSGILDRNFLLEEGPNRSEAFLAIEGPTEWPKLPKAKGEGKSAGPFYLVWKQPELSGIPPEYWPYQLSGLTFEKNLKAIFPKIYPKTSQKEVLDGFKVFQDHCMACHSINHQGTAKLGPDLNLPMNPTEYLQPKALRKFLKDPTSVRVWQGMKMKWGKAEELSEQDISHLIHYLEHMAKSR